MKPIIFNTEMVRAILEDRKTVTRRAMKPQPELVGRFWVFGDARWSDTIRTVTPFPGHTMYNRAPYRHGDILWVRETWRKRNGQYEYRADDECPEGWRNMVPWHPSIHMPREAARLFLRVTDVRAERLQDISLDPPGPENQVIKEGCLYLCDFVAVWERTLNSADRPVYAWDANPWVWVISFERISKEEAGQDEWV